jgi:hypothetical protein
MRSGRLLLAPLLLMVVAVAGCTSDAGSASRSANTVVPPASKADVHTVNWRNASYSIACPGLGGPSDQQVPVTLASGHGTTDPVTWFGTPTRIDVRLVDVSYGDVNRDGTDDAVVHLSCNPQRSNGVADELQVFGPGSELLAAPVLRNPNASDFAPAIKTLTITNGAITGSAYFWAANDPHCCPSETRPFTLTWNATRSAFDQS